MPVSGMVTRMHPDYLSFGLGFQASYTGRQLLSNANGRIFISLSDSLTDAEMQSAIASPLHLEVRPAKKKISWQSLLIGASMNIFQVTTLGQPMENMKTWVSAHRNASLREAAVALWARGPIKGFYQGLIPWAWLEASSKGAILMLASSEAAYQARYGFGASPATAAALGGIAGGAAQSYLTMGMTTCMKTVELTRNKTAVGGGRVPSTMECFFQILRTQGIRGVNKGVNAVALRQITGWSSRMGISKAAEGAIRMIRGVSAEEKLLFGDKMAASIVGGVLSCWNQPFEVIRVEMQTVKGEVPTGRPTMISTAALIWRENGVRGFFRGIIPRIGVASWATICMVGMGDTVKEAFGRKA